jgi:hypothetical protein
MVDINGDGWLDIYVCNGGEIPGDDRANELYINQRNGQFKEEAHAYGLDDRGISTRQYSSTMITMVTWIALY